MGWAWGESQGCPRKGAGGSDSCLPRPPQEKADRAALEEEVRSLRHNNRRLQAESESAATRLLLASKQLGSPTADLA